jgi:hypothetical protein
MSLNGALRAGCVTIDKRQEKNRLIMTNLLKGA